MDVIRKGLRLGDSESGERGAGQETSVARALEPEATIRTKLKSAWNNVKYGKNAWATSEMFKPGFSRNSPVWLLGQAYHRKLTDVTDPTSPVSSPTGEAVRTFSESDRGHEAFQRDFRSRLWLTYRRDLAGLAPGLTSDCGWGCMVRSGQMMVAQALSLHWLGRGWRLGMAGDWQSERLHRAIIQVFSDVADTQLAPLSLHSLVGGRAGDWCGPHTVSHLLAGAARAAPAGAGRGLLDSLVIYVAQDCTVYRQDVEELCLSPPTEPGSDFSLLDLPQPAAQEVDIDGETWCMEQRAGPSQAWNSLIILVPLRLGGETFNPIYSSCLKNLLSLECCIGIIGGKPRHSLYFIGFQDDDLIHLDPHRLQDRVDTTKTDFSTESYHCPSPRKINLKRIDPSCCVGFYLRDKSEFDGWRETISQLVTPPHIAGLRAEYPLFVVSDGRSVDTRSETDWVTLGPEESNDQNLHTEEFVFL